MSGWIKIHRQIKKNWVFEDAEYLKAWVIILLEVNHTPKKIPIKSQIFTCNRGESLKSLDTWSALFGVKWNKSKVRRFFAMLESDSMIIIKSETVTTRLSVCNYDGYQDIANADETQVKRICNASETHLTPNKNVKNEEKVKEDNIPYGNIISFLNEKTGNKYKPTTKKTKDLVKARFNEGFTEEDFKTVIKNKSASWSGDPQWSKYLRPETLFGTKFEGYLNEKSSGVGESKWI